MSSWQWFHEFSQEATQRGDKVPARMLDLHHQAFYLRETDPDQTLSLFAEAQRIARGYGHPWWVMLFQQWQVHGAIHYKRDVRNILDSAVRNLLAVSKPVYAGYPQRVWVANDLISIYQCVDPLGYEEAIRAAITYLENEGSAEAHIARYAVQMSKIDFALERNRLDEALDLTMTAQAWLEADPDRETAGHYRLDLTAYPALIALKKRDWTELASAAEVAEEAARQRNFHTGLATALMWQAAAARNAGDKQRAGRLFRAAHAERRKLGGPPHYWFYDPWAVYEEGAGAPAAVLQVRTREFTDIRDRGILAYECSTLTELCRLKIALGTFQSEDREAAYRAAMRLRKPKSYLSALESAVSGKSASA